MRIAVLVIMAAVGMGGSALVRSYNYYSQIIDARLASGYLTSRPGLYAAPRVLQAGQKLSREKVIACLRRAGYLETSASNVWSGSFIASDAAVEIRPGRSSVRKQVALVRITFDEEQIAELTGDGVALDSFT